MTEGQPQLDRVPRSHSEESQLLATRQPGWEYLFFGAVLLRQKDELEAKWLAHEVHVRVAAAEPISAAEAIDRLSRVLPEARAIVEKLTQSLTPEAQEKAFGKAGESGDPQQIEHLAEAIVGGYNDLLDWSARLREEGVPDVLHAVFEAASSVADAPLREFREFVDRCVAEFDKLPTAVRGQAPIGGTLTLTLRIDDTALGRFEDELRDATAHITKPEAERKSVSLVAAEIPIPAGLGFFEGRRAKRAVKEYEEAFAHWRAERDACVERLTLAETYRGEQSTQMILKAGEAVFAAITGASLIEDRRGPGEWSGSSSGFSVPIGSIGGRSIRYRTGSSRGHYVQGTPVPTPIDTGTLYVTNQRIVFRGLKQTRECRFDKLIGFEHIADGSTVFSVSNRQKSTRVHYGAALLGWFDFRLDLGLAHFQDKLQALVQQIEADLAAIDDSQPSPPALESSRA